MNQDPLLLLRLNGPSNIEQILTPKNLKRLKKKKSTKKRVPFGGYVLH